MFSRTLLGSLKRPRNLGLDISIFHLRLDVYFGAWGASVSFLLGPPLLLFTFTFLLSYDSFFLFLPSWMIMALGGCGWYFWRAFGWRIHVDCPLHYMLFLLWAVYIAFCIIGSGHYFCIDCILLAKTTHPGEVFPSLVLFMYFWYITAVIWLNGCVLYSYKWEQIYWKQKNIKWRFIKLALVQEPLTTVQVCTIVMHILANLLPRLPFSRA